VFRYLVRRLIWAAVLMVAVTFVSFVIFFLVPASPARLMAGPQAPPEHVERIEKLLGLDDPVPVQYARFLKQLVVDQSLGHSFATRQEVNDIIKAAAPVTASLVLGGVVIWLMIAFPIGILSALRPRTLLDRAGMVFVLIGVSAHPVWIGLLLSYLVGFKLGLTPLGGYCDMINPSTDCGGPAQWAHSLLLPWVTFALLYAALYTRMIRANVMEAMNEDYVRTARAKGAPESRVMRGHILRNALLPIVTILGMDIGLLLGGAIFTESVFGLPGLGKTAVQSLEGFDLPTVQGIVVFATLAIIALNLIVDLLYAVIDPRIRLS
jgi:peptide/nickel transport system permease protein